MTRYAVIGAGMMGRVIARDLVDSDPSATVGLFDRSAELLEEAGSWIANERLRCRELDVRRRDETARELSPFDVAVAAVPHALSLDVLESAIAAQTSVVDLVGEAPERRRALDERARASQILLLPGCGVAPGISNFCAGRGVELLDETTSVFIYVGGIPKSPSPPLFYQTVYLLESVFNAYRREATIVRGGKELEVPALSGVESLDFPEPIGPLEAFYTDGLGSLPLTLGQRVSGELSEKTLRYPGHLERVRTLAECGLLSDTPVSVEGIEVRPLRLLLRVLEDKLMLGPEGDWLVMRILVEGRKDGAPRKHRFDLLDELDRTTGYTAMARTTGLTAAIAARWVASGKIPEKGVVFPEEIFLGDRFDDMVQELAGKGVVVRHTSL